MVALVYFIKTNELGQGAVFFHVGFALAIQEDCISIIQKEKRKEQKTTASYKDPGRYLILLQLSVASVSRQLEGFLCLGTCFGLSPENNSGIFG